MAIVPDELRAQLRERFAETLTKDVELRLYTRAGSGIIALPAGIGCGTCGPFREIAEALEEAAAGRIRLLVVEDRPGEVPVLEVARPGADARLSFRGLPAGYEFSTLLDAIERTSSGDVGLSAETVGALAGLEADVDLQVFVTPTCPYCPSAASMANRLAMASPRIRAATIAANEFPELSERFHVRGVPHTVVNSSRSFVGALPEDAFLEQVLRNAGEAPAS